MIATAKVLGLKTSDFAALAAAAWRVVEYVQGGADARRTPHAGSGTAHYYSGGSGTSGQPDPSRTGHVGSAGDPNAQAKGARVVEGVARGSAAGLMGLEPRVPGEDLHRLLMGQHAGTGAWLVSGRGSPGRALAAVPSKPSPLPAQPQFLTLAQAAAIAGVSAPYLRRLAENHELEQVAATHRPKAQDPGAPTPVAGEEGQPQLADDETPVPDESREYLRAFRDPDGRRWLVSRNELGRYMRERQPPTVVIGYDLVCSAPKSVSLLRAFGDEALRADITAALDAGVDAAIGYLEQHAVVGTVGGKNRPGLGLAAASYQHEISRSEEAHLHVHNVIANAVAVPLLDETGRPVLDENGVARVEWRTLDGEVLLRHVRTAGFVGAAALRHELAVRRGMEWGPVRNGVAELAAFPRNLLEAFSTRHGEVTEEFAQLVDAGFDADSATMAAAQRGSRAAKRVLSDPQVEAIQRDKLIEAGWSVPRVQALAAARSREVTAPSPSDVEGLFEQLVGPGGLAKQQPTFTQREVHQQVAAWAGDRLNADGVREVAQRFLSDPRLVRMRVAAKRRRNEDEDIYTTAELLEVEDALMGLYRQGRTDHGGPPRAPVEAELGEDAIEAISERLRNQTGDPAARLSDEQGTLVRQLLASGDLIRPVMGPAGTGKTEAMRALVHAYTAAGYTVLGTANGGRQAEELHERLEIRSEVVTSWLTRLDTTPDPGMVWAGGTVLILDEATQVSTRDGERFLRYATRTDTVVILVGDPTQLGSVGAGGWFRHLIDTCKASGQPVPGLKVNQRQTGDGMRQVRHALAALRPAIPAADQQALSILARDGRIVVVETREEMLEAVVEDWHTERRLTDHPQASATAGGLTASRLAGRSRMMAENHRDTDQLNRAARTRLTADAILTGPVLRVAGREFQAGDEVITLTQAGHTLIPAGKPRSAYIRTGTVGIITAVHTDAAAPDRQHLTVRFPERGEVKVGWDYLTHEFDDGRDGGLAHAYALTAHKAEGSTMPTARALLHDATSRAGLYVMLSRAKSDLRAYLIRARDLAADLDDEDWLPVIRDKDGPMRALLNHLAGSREERLASDYDPIARAAHQLATRHTLPELVRLRRQALRAITHPDLDDPEDEGAAQKALILYRAELAAAARVGHAAIADPDPELIAAMGPRPAGGAHLAVWDQAVAAFAVHALRNPPSTMRAGPGPNGPDSPDQEDPIHMGDGRDVLGQDDVTEGQWALDRSRAQQIADQWAQYMPPAKQKRFHTAQEQIPRLRAIAGLHALLAHGHAEQRLHNVLIAEPLTDVRAGAAVLEHRVHELLQAEGLLVAAELYQLPAPATDQQHQIRLQQLYTQARVRHLATHPTAALTGELRHLTHVLTAAEQAATGPDGSEWHERLRRTLIQHHADAALALQRADANYEAARTALARLELQRRPTSAALASARTTRSETELRQAERRQALRLAHELLLITGGAGPSVNKSTLPGSRGSRAGSGPEEAAGSALAHVQEHQRLLEEALAHQIDLAAIELTQEPAPYLIAFLGHRPEHAAAVNQWYRQAIAIEHYRHHHLGLPYGTPAAASTQPASVVALGPRPAHEHQQALYDRLLSGQSTLDISASLP